MLKRRRSTAKLITFGGKSMTMRAWAEHCGITTPGMHARLKHWPIEQALTTDKYRPRTQSIGPRFAWIDQAGVGAGSNTLGKS